MRLDSSDAGGRHDRVTTGQIYESPAHPGPATA